MYLALDDDDAAAVVDGNTSRVLEHVRAKLPHKLSVLVKYLHLVCGASFRHHYIS